MQYIDDTPLTSFQFWSGGKDHALMLTYSEMEELDLQLSNSGAINELWTATEINDLFWFDMKTICEILGYTWDEENAKIIRTRA